MGMELLVMGALAYAGKKINEKDEENNTKMNKPKCNRKKIKKTKKSLYESSNIIKNKNKVKTLINNTHKKSNQAHLNNYISAEYKDQKKPTNLSDETFLEQFNVLQFDSRQPTSANYVNGFEDNTYSTFSNQDMTYNIIKNRDDFLHNNMNANTSQRDFALQTNEGVMKDRLELFTGFPEDFKRKKETKPLFEPMKDLSNVNGMPVNTDFMEQRYLPSNKKNDEDLPFENNVKVIPGVSGKNQEGTYGTYRLLPKTTDELRTSNNPKVSYKGTKIEAVKKGEFRPNNPNVVSHKPLTYKVNKKEKCLQPIDKSQFTIQVPLNQKIVLLLQIK